MQIVFWGFCNFEFWTNEKKEFCVVFGLCSLQIKRLSFVAIFSACKTILDVAFFIAFHKILLGCQDTLGLKFSDFIFVESKPKTRTVTDLVSRNRKKPVKTCTVTVKVHGGFEIDFFDTKDTKAPA